MTSLRQAALHLHMGRGACLPSRPMLWEASPLLVNSKVSLLLYWSFHEVPTPINHVTGPEGRLPHFHLFSPLVSSVFLA